MSKITVSDTSSIISDLSIKCYGYTDSNLTNPHVSGFRNTYILNYVVSGNGIFNGKHMKPGMGFLIKPGKHFDYTSNPKALWSCFWVTFNGTEAEKICKNFIKANANGVFKFDFPERLRTLIDIIFQDTHFISQASALSHFFKLISYHEEIYTGLSNKYIEQAKDYIKCNFHKKLTIKDIARFLSINDRYLYNLFMKHENISPKAYINNLKIYHAKSLLRNTTFSIAEIAESSGFSDQLAFSHFFKKETGISPSDYRKKKLSTIIK